MTRKDYELIATSIFVDRDSLKTAEEKSAVDVIAKGLADQLEAMNPRFNREQFLTVCGYGLD